MGLRGLSLLPNLRMILRTFWKSGLANSGTIGAIFPKWSPLWLRKFKCYINHNLATVTLKYIFEFLSLVTCHRAPSVSLPDHRVETTMPWSSYPRRIIAIRIDIRINMSQFQVSQRAP